MKSDIHANWYSVSVLFESVRLGETVDSEIDKDKEDLKLFEHKIIVTKANNIEESYNKADNYAKNEEFEYENSLGEKVKNKFVSTLHAVELDDDEITTGVEVYSRFIHACEQDTSQSVIQRYFPEALME
ncbi:protein of unknown function [Marininema mesophilum]|uniref:DUF4288 domain-containing protein n=1 Tax=Marininema mesophilum TaxID=1048340 RepID=A0A1H3BWX7_9BACL|nr:DUF4288 domain-containing protein [Marininema mesophilum]SDX46427.1 protein of unknown function [Marininema mesophilum]